MTSSLQTLDTETDQVTVSLDKAADSGIRFVKKQTAPTPLHAMEAALSGCIGLTLLSIVKDKNDKQSLEGLFYSVRIGESGIKITCSCDESLQSLFREAVDVCYISKLVLLRKEIVFTTRNSVHAK